MSNRKKKSQRQARDQWYFFGKAAFTKKQQNITMNPHQHSLFFSISELLEKSFKNTHRKHSQRADKTPTRERSTDSEDDMKLSKQHSSSRSTGQHTGRVEMPVWNPFFFFLTIYPVVSLWKPGVPYPVHGRVLVEIQRPRSLHRKAVIQLNTERNQHNQSKQQVSHTVRHEGQSFVSKEEDTGFKKSLLKMGSRGKKTACF